MTLKVDKKKLAIAFAKVAVDVKTGNVAAAIKGVIDAATAFTRDGPGDATAEDGAHLLLQRGAYRAAILTIQRFARQAPLLAAEADLREIEAELVRHTADTSLELTAAAFSDPERWPALSVVLDAFTGWLRVCRVPEEHREAMRLAFREDVVLALAAELRDRSREADYRALLAEVTRETPLDEAAQRALDWRAYRARLAAAVHRPLRSLDPERIPRKSLHDLYVPLRAAVGEMPTPERRRENGKPIPIRWLDDELDTWIAKADPNDPVRVLSGEPGSGKSSSCAMLAARLARKGRRVLLVPLGRLNHTGDARAELSRFLTDELGHDALEHARGDDGPPLLLILDGLDELAKFGQMAMTLLNGFISTLSVARSDWNRNGLRVLLLLAGRPGAAEATDAMSRAEGARLHVLRFRIKEEWLGLFDDETLAEQDQRPDWWRRFGCEDGLPPVLRQPNPHLTSLTEQPLLNWLIAQILTLEGAERAATIDGLHELYRRLFGHVLDRVNRRDANDPLEAIDRLKREDLQRMLEEVAVAAWHNGGDRTVPFPEVRKRLEDAELDRHLSCLTTDRDEALTCLLDSFFCRAHAGQTHRAVEFTHKSFGQFLTAKRIVREVESLHDLLDRRGGRNTLLNALGEWLALCGPAAMDRDLLDFLRSEIAAAARDEQGKRTVTLWRESLARLFDESVRQGMPLPSGDFRSREAERRVRNAEVALFAALHATVLATLPESERSIIRLEPEEAEPTTLTLATLHRLLGPTIEWSIARFCLSCLNLAGADLRSADMRSADLTGANLGDANLGGADLRRANLTGANLTGADLGGANLTRANLMHAHLTRTYLGGANLGGAVLTGADLTGANLTDADLRDANLTGADLTLAKLMRAHLWAAKLRDANLTDADLRDANLTGARNVATKGNVSASPVVCDASMQTACDGVG